MDRTRIQTPLLRSLPLSTDLHIQSIGAVRKTAVVLTTTDLEIATPEMWKHLCLLETDDDPVVPELVVLFMLTVSGFMFWATIPNLYVSRALHVNRNVLLSFALSLQGSDLIHIPEAQCFYASQHYTRLLSLFFFSAMLTLACLNK